MLFAGATHPHLFLNTAGPASAGFGLLGVAELLSIGGQNWPAAFAALGATAAFVHSLTVAGLAISKEGRAWADRRDAVRASLLAAAAEQARQLLFDAAVTAAAVLAHKTPTGPAPSTAGTEAPGAGRPGPAGPADGPAALAPHTKESPSA